MNPEHLNEEPGESFTCVLLLMGRLSCFRDNWLYYKGVLRWVVVYLIHVSVFIITFCELLAYVL